MGQTHGRVGSIDALSAVAGRTHNVDTDILVVNYNVKFLRFRHNRHRRGGCMDPAAGFRLRHTLHPVDAALILHLGICALACHHEHNLLETSDSVLIDADKLRLPAVALRKMHIHSVKLRGKKGCFVAAGAGTDFHHDVLVIIRIFGKQENLQLLLHFLNSFFRIGQFFLGHITHLLVRLFLEQGQAVFHILVRLLMVTSCICLQN